MKIDRFQDCHCRWCDSFKPPYLHKVNNVYWFEIPKNACTSIKDHYGFRETKKFGVPRSKWKSLAESGVCPVVVWRDPIDRFVSLLNHYLYAEGIGGRFSLGENLFHPEDFRNIPPKARIDGLFDRLDKLSTEHEVHHWYPQSFFVDTKVFKEFLLIPMKNVTAAFKLRATRSNVSPSVISRKDLSEAQIKIVKDLYKSDYEFLADQLGI